MYSISQTKKCSDAKTKCSEFNISHILKLVMISKG